MQELYIGMMSGTSMDGIDAALVDFSTHHPKLLHTYTLSMPSNIRADLITLCHPGNDEINRLGTLDVQMGQLFAQTVKKLLETAHIPANKIKAIGSHGQTIRHQPKGPYPFTLQIGDPNIIAHETKIKTIADFRRRDIAAGGQGAPLGPAFHNYVFRNAQEDRIVLNLGGIANITWLPKDLNKSVIGFDTGPSNTLLDSWASKHLAKNYDENGAWAASGKINPDLLNNLLADPYFKLPYPKSTGREYFNLDWLNKFNINLSPQDLQATLCELTAQSITHQINQLTSKGKILVGGGGIKNLYLIERLKINCPSFTVHSTEEFGVPPQWVEAMAFAWLAKQTLNNLSSNLPSVTGAKQEVILGGIYNYSH